MTILKMLQQSAILTVLGMAIVFVFLWVMIICVNAVGKIVHTMSLDKDVREPKNEPKRSTGTTAEVTAAITAAVKEYRNDK